MTSSCASGMERGRRGAGMDTCITRDNSWGPLDALGEGSSLSSGTMCRRLKFC
jgi:hypothetical protein